MRVWKEQMMMANQGRDLLLWASQEKKLDFDKGCEPLVQI